MSRHPAWGVEGAGAYQAERLLACINRLPDTSFREFHQPVKKKGIYLRSRMMALPAPKMTAAAMAMPGRSSARIASASTIA